MTDFVKMKYLANKRFSSEVYLFLTDLPWHHPHPISTQILLNYEKQNLFISWRFLIGKFGIHTVELQQIY